MHIYIERITNRNDQEHFHSLNLSVVAVSRLRPSCLSIIICKCKTYWVSKMKSALVVTFWC